MISDYLQQMELGVTNSLRLETRVTFSRLYDDEGLRAQWYTEKGKFYFQPRGKRVRTMIPGMYIHERCSDEVSAEQCAQLMFEHGIPPHEVRINPVVTLTFSDSAKN